MMKINRDLPPQIEEIVKAVCAQCRAAKQKPPHLIIPINRGNGRTSIARIVATRYRENGARSFSGRESFLDYKLSGTTANIDEVYLDIQANCEYANDFHGIVALDIDDLLPKLNETTGNKFFEMTDNIKRDVTLIIFVPVDCQKTKLDTLLNKAGMSFQLLPPVEPANQDVAKLFWECLPKDISANKSFKAHEEQIAAYITKTAKCLTYSAAMEAAGALHYTPETLNQLLGISGQHGAGQENREVSL